LRALRGSLLTLLATAAANIIRGAVLTRGRAGAELGPESAKREIR
jgi:hypothetical protein